MATSPEAVRAQFALVTTAAVADLTAITSQVALEQQVDAAIEALGLIVPSYYDAAGSLAVAWYDEIRDESSPTTVYAPTIIGDPTTDWIEREAAKFRKQLDLDLEAETALMLEEISRLAEKEVARGFRDTVGGNSRSDEDAIGWSRVTRPGACKLCVMAADRGVVYRKETASFAAHTNCHCAARPAFRGGVNGPEASVEQYIAAKKRRTERERKALRKYLNENYPDAPG
jgi:hypothetical protein